MSATAQEIITELQRLGNPEKAVHLSRFFKTGPGEYGEGDLFLGITVPQQRLVARKYRETDLEVLHELLMSPFHEVRLTALLILLEQFQKNKTEAFRQTCVDFYLAHTASINNWDLVDLSCYKLLGVWLADKDRSLLYRLVRSENLWEQRIAIVTCMHFVRQGDFRDCLELSTQLLSHRHALIHKAVGWLLRETGKKHPQVLRNFLDIHHTTMPRTMLRYAIELFPEKERKAYLQGKVRQTPEDPHP